MYVSLLADIRLHVMTWQITRLGVAFFSISQRQAFLAFTLIIDKGTFYLRQAELFSTINRTVSQ